ncbi:dihydroorotate dehydrogenase electron transfer subunit [Orbaceae bacterium ESL0727]|nr:dihydroorotate dehydrogenase electron transfer subunit [Orbaceae bacterium ESL0727]
MAAIDSLSIIISNEWVNDEYKHLIVKVNTPALTVEPGQFFNLLCPQSEADKPFFRRPMSTYFADPVSGTIEFLYKVVGSGTRTLAKLQTGDTLPILGPLGKGFTIKDHYQHILVVGRGVGLATLAPLAEAAVAKKIKVTAILSARDQNSLMSQHRFHNIHANVIEVIDSNHSSKIENVEKLIIKQHKIMPFDAVYTCGSTRITTLLRRIAMEFNLDGQVALEQHMACGLGMCYCCVKPFNVTTGTQTELRNKRVCVDGPVFDIKEFIA